MYTIGTLKTVKFTTFVLVVAFRAKLLLEHPTLLFVLQFRSLTTCVIGYVAI